MDVGDHMIKNTANNYITWKSWHAPYLHEQTVGIVAATACTRGVVKDIAGSDLKD
jgi:hypothetical protein